MIIMVGYWSYTVILTYLSVICACVGIGFSASGVSNDVAIICLVICGGLDMFDGKVARTKKNRTEGEKDFGVQIDSLSDIIAFGILPACIGYNLITPLQGHWYFYVFVAMIFVYVLFGLVRLAYFNTLENERDRKDDKPVKEYLGLPITNAALLLPVAYILKFIVSAEAFIYIYMGCLVLLSLLYVIKFKLKKPNKYYAIFMSIFGALLIAGLVVLLLLKK